MLDGSSVADWSWLADRYSSSGDVSANFLRKEVLLEEVLDVLPRATYKRASSVDPVIRWWYRPKQTGRNKPSTSSIMARHLLAVGIVLSSLVVCALTADAASGSIEDDL